jgi:uncharacterized protein (TIGR03067 family)
VKKHQTDEKDILGTWRMYDHAMNGTRHESRDVCWRFDPDGKLFCVHTKTGKEYPMGYALDPAGEPKRMAWTPDPGAAAYASIYKLDGDTLYVVCPVEKDGPRPAAFAPAKGVYYTEFRREPAAK